jgi:hypothetical protein
MKPLFCWLKAAGRPKNERDRVRVNFMMDAELHEFLLAEAGRRSCTLTDMLNMTAAVGLPVLAFHHELIPTLRTKFVQSTKKNTAR